MRYGKIPLRLFALAFVMLFAGPTMAMPVVYTDRGAFDAAVGGSTHLTLDTPTRTLEDPSFSLYQATYNDLITFSFDLQGGVGVGVIPGAVVMGKTGLQATADVLQPVTAFGFDVVSKGSDSVAFSMGGQHPLSGIDFLGFVSASPFIPDLAYFAVGSRPLPPSEFVIDNIAIQVVPEPSTWVLVMVGGLVVVWAHWRTSRLSGSATHQL